MMLFFCSKVVLAVAAVAIHAYKAPVKSRSDNVSHCHVLPGDQDWPSTPAWDTLNTTIGGKLIKTVPIGTVCHSPGYNEVACQELQNKWSEPATHYDSSSSVMVAYWANASCDPWTPQSTPCSLGNYVSYAVDVRSAEDVAATIKFAKERNVRFLVRNTGHEYVYFISSSFGTSTDITSFFGRSTGAGALAAWTHNLKDISKSQWSDDSYEGPAFKLGAGVQGIEIITAAEKENLVVVAGYCPTVGLAGGWTQGAGHSPLTTNFGLGADQTLEFEVVTADGNIVKASKTENSDLYWALSGGGPGIYGVLTAVTIRAYEDLPVGGMGIYFNPSDTTPDKFWTALEKLYSTLPAVTDDNMHVTFSYNTTLFIMTGVTAYNQSSSAVKTTMGPFLEVINELQIQHKIWFTDSQSYLEHSHEYSDVQAAVLWWQSSGRLIPRRVLAGDDETAPEAFDDLIKVLRAVYDDGVLVGVSAMSPQNRLGVDNAVHPAWRDATVLLSMLRTWDNEPSAWEDNLAMQQRLTHVLLPEVERVTPDSGSYMNEADPFQKDWKEAYFGPNYSKLLSIKDKYDPEGVFYARMTVGSDRWDVADDGRMCRV
ncbi:hypothetical protein PG985_014172 [Apiospora marii]